jgi:tRNA pseudouridine38-40 synthase
MARFKLWLEYQGTRYRGWQRQPNARTVQGEIYKALLEIFVDGKFEFQGAGRTDAGVHALGQIAHLEAPHQRSAEDLRRKLNDQLPPDINILRLEPASFRFHARHHAVSRSYMYQISRRRTAFGKQLVWWVRDDLDLGLMRQAAGVFPGMRDFASFTDDEPEEKSTRVLIEELEVKEAGDLILIRVRGSHFLWKMVRRIVGVLVEVGRGKLPIQQVEGFLRERSGRPAELTAPPSGLFLEHVWYPDDDPALPLLPVMRIGPTESDRPA